MRRNLFAPLKGNGMVQQKENTVFIATKKLPIGSRKVNWKIKVRMNPVASEGCHSKPKNQRHEFAIEAVHRDEERQKAGA
jgi:hypothetical protein